MCTDDGRVVLGQIVDLSMCTDDGRVVFGQIVDAVYFMHRHGLAHRNLKPSNVSLKQKLNLLMYLKHFDSIVRNKYLPERQR